MTPRLPRLWWISQPQGPIDLARCVALGAATGDDARDALVLLRWPSQPPEMAVTAAHALRRELRAAGAALAVGVRLGAAPTDAVARALVGLELVHLAAGADLAAARAVLCAVDARCVLTIAAHDEAEVQRAALADAVLLSPVRATPSKPAAKPLGWQGLRALTAVSPCPVVALGGLSPVDAASTVAAGVRGLALLSAAWRDPIALHAEALSALLRPTAAAPWSP